MKKILIYLDESKYPCPRDGFINYRNAFTGCGAEVMVSCDQSDVDRADALLLPGGEDVEPSRYGQPTDPSCFLNVGRDEAEFYILDKFVRDGRPVIGICRGEQVLNVYFGGSLHQNIPGHGRVGDPPRDSAHLVRTDDPLLVKLYGGERFSVNSSHHQVIDRVGEGLTAMAWNEQGYVEGIRHNTLPIYAVQWHPERMCFANAREDTVDGALLIKALIDAI